MIRSARELWEYRYLVWNLAQRDLRSRYKKSVLGWLWSLINPASTLVIFTIVFGVLLRTTPEPAANGDANFGLYLFAGIVVWNFFSTVVNGSISALAASGGLLKKVYFPPAAPAVANLLVALSQVVIEFGILAAFMILWGNWGWQMLLFPAVIVLTGLFALGIGLWVSILNLFYRDIGYLVGIGLNVWFYATPIVYPLAIVRPKDGQPAMDVLGIEVETILRLNPITNLVEMNRDFFYFHRLPGVGPVAYILLATVASLVVGTFMFNRKAQYVSEEV